RLHRTSSYRPKPLPVLRWVDNLRPWRPSASLPNSKTVPRGLVPSLRYGLDLNGLRRDPSVWAVLFVILLFLLIECEMHDSSSCFGPSTGHSGRSGKRLEPGLHLNKSVIRLSLGMSSVI